MGYKIFGKELKEEQYFTMIGSEDIFVFRGTGFKNLRDPNVTISKHKYHKFRPYWLQRGDKIAIRFSDDETGATFYENTSVKKIEYSSFTDLFKVTYHLTEKDILGSLNLNDYNLKKIIPI